MLGIFPNEDNRVGIEHRREGVSSAEEEEEKYDWEEEEEEEEEREEEKEEEQQDDVQRSIPKNKNGAAPFCFVAWCVSSCMKYYGEL